MEMPDYDDPFYFANYSELVEDMYEIVDTVYSRIIHYIFNFKN